ncbi:MAG TPA: hypothetical protein VNF45_10290 [Candidatus Binataceae bacterium]|nr:hypothetical protein [Candidatus Binataceae bacterium]
MMALTGYMVFFAGHYVSGDNAYRIAWAKALIDHHGNDISSYIPGTVYTKYGIGGALLHIPFIIAARIVKRLTGIACEGPVNMMLYELNAALGVALIYAILTERCGIERRDGVFRALAIGFASVWFPYSKVEYAESLVATALLAAWLLAEQWAWAAGLIGGFAIALRMDAALWFGLIVVIAPGRYGQKIKLAGGAAPGVLITLWSNYARSGNVFNSGYEINFSTPLLTGLYGFLLSAGKSIFLFSPLLILYAPSALMLWRRKRCRELVAWSLALLAGQLCFYGKWWDWSGDDAWGPRLVILSTLAALIVVAASDWAATKWFTALAVCGLVLQMPPALMGPHTSVMLDHTREASRARSWSGEPVCANLDDLRFNPACSQVTNTAELLLMKMLPGNKEWIARTAWIAGMRPELTPDEISYDLLWLRPHGGSHDDGASYRWSSPMSSQAAPAGSGQ